MLARVAKGIGAVGRRVGAVLPVAFRDGVGLVAVGAIAYGAWMIYPPVGFITGGVLTLAGVMLSATMSGR